MKKFCAKKNFFFSALTCDLPGFKKAAVHCLIIIYKRQLINWTFCISLPLAYIANRETNKVRSIFWNQQTVGIKLLLFFKSKFLNQNFNFGGKFLNFFVKFFFNHFIIWLMSHIWFIHVYESHISWDLNSIDNIEEKKYYFIFKKEN